MKAESWRTPAVILWCGALILAVSLGIRHVRNRAHPLWSFTA